jgi:hypothetical protein
MKTLFSLIDQGSSGLLLITDDRYLAHALSTGIMDSEITPLFTWDQETWRNEMDEETITRVMNNWDDWCVLGKFQYTEFVKSQNRSYNLFKYKKSLVQVRYSVIKFLIETSRYYERRYDVGFSDGGYDSALELLKDPQLIKLYAAAISATTMSATQELNMTYSSNKDMRARVYIAYHHYLSKINKITTKDEADILINEIGDGFALGHGFE